MKIKKKNTENFKTFSNLAVRMRSRYIVRQVDERVLGSRYTKRERVSDIELAQKRNGGIIENPNKTLLTVLLPSPLLSDGSHSLHPIPLRLEPSSISPFSSPPLPSFPSLSYPPKSTFFPSSPRSSPFLRRCFDTPAGCFDTPAS